MLVRSDDGWGVAAFEDDDSYPDALTLQGRDLVSYHKECVPSCADGRAIERFWEWNGAAFETDPLPPPPTTAALSPGQPCSPGSSPDCTDIGSSDGTYRYIEGWSECIEDIGDGCHDLDGDGRAGYPDSN